MRLIRFGTVDLPELNGIDNMPIEYRANYASLQNGAYDYDGQKNVLNATTITRDAVITQNIQTTLQNITRQANKGRALLRGKELDDTQYVTFAKVSRINYLPNAEKYGCEQALGIGFTQDYPFWLHAGDIETFLDDGAQFDDYAWNFDGGNYESVSINASSSGITSQTVTIDNTGTAPIYRGYFALQFVTEYDVNWIKITNVTNGLTMTYNMNIAGSSDIGTWYFDWLSKSLLTNTSDLDRTGLVIPNNQSDWFRLDLGENQIQVDISHNDDTNMNLYIFYSRHYTY